VRVHNGQDVQKEGKIVILTKCVSVCVRVCVCEREEKRKRKGGMRERDIQVSFSSFSCTGVSSPGRAI
jgi:hypothetical protein